MPTPNVLPLGSQLPQVNARLSMGGGAPLGQQHLATLNLVFIVCLFRCFAGCIDKGTFASPLFHFCTSVLPEIDSQPWQPTTPRYSVFTDSDSH